MTIMPQKKTQDDTCYHFTLKCLAGLFTAAAVAAGVIMAATASTAAAVSTTALATTALATSALMATSLLPIGLGLGGALLLIGGICLLPCLFCRSSRPTTYVTTPNTGGWFSTFPFWSTPTFGSGYSGYQPSFRPGVTGGVGYSSHQHGHQPTQGSVFFPSHQHGHQPTHGGVATPGHRQGHAVSSVGNDGGHQQRHGH